MLQSVKIILCDQVQAARTLLDNSKPISDSNVHAARKHLKSARAGLRLLRGTVGERHYSIENTRLRDAARPLSNVRDTKVLIETAVVLLKTEKNHHHRARLLDLVRLLRRERNKLRSELLPGRQTLQSARATLAKSKRAISRWSLDGPSIALSTDVERLYRKSRNAMRLARKELTDDALHEARKQVKYFANAMEMLQGSGAQNVIKLINCAKAISDKLGADHDLALIQFRLMTSPNSQPRISKDLSTQIQQRRLVLQGKAFRGGKRLHKATARVFVKHLSVFIS